MKISIIHKESKIEKSEHNFFNEFIEFLHEEYPLKKDIKILFVGKRATKSMTTGERTDNDELLILTSGRLNRDIIRTLSHEWVHEYQSSVKNKKKGKDIGGPLENEANAISGQLVKKFEKKFPKYEKLIYKTHEKSN